MHFLEQQHHAVRQYMARDGSGGGCGWRRRCGRGGH
jgi:hypothetical protein